MKNTKLCVFCKSRIDEGDTVCPFCGIEATNTNPIGSLELGAVVKKKYTIGRFLSIDGEGITYEALVNSTAEEVYIKEFLPISLCASRRPTGEVIPRPGNEVQYKTTLTDYIDLYKGLMGVSANPGLVKVLDLLQDNNTAYAVTERVVGKTLRTYLEQKNQKIPFEEAEEMLEPIFSALLSLHEQRLLHRGVSPDTIIVKEDGKLILSGYATLALRTSKSALKPQLFPGYTAPEQYVVTEFQDTGTDIYSVAAVLYRMITGVEPQDAKERYTADNLKVARGLAGNIPNLATSAIHRALRLSISERTSDIMQLLEEFEAAPSAPAQNINKPQQSKKNSGMNPLIIVVIVMVLLAGIIIYYAYSLIQSTLVPENPTDSENQADDLVESVVSEAINSQLTPRIIGMMYADVLADTDLQNKYLFSIEEEYNVNYPEGQVYAQQPLPEEPYVDGQTILLRVSLGPEIGVIPAELYGMTKEEAMALLSEMGVSYEFYNRFDDSATAGTVIYSEPSVGDDVVLDENTRVQLFIAVPTDEGTPPT